MSSWEGVPEHRSPFPTPCADSRCRRPAETKAPGRKGEHWWERRQALSRGKAGGFRKAGLESQEEWPAGGRGWAASGPVRHPAATLTLKGPPTFPGAGLFWSQVGYTGLTFSPGAPLLRAVRPKEAPHPHRCLSCWAGEEGPGGRGIFSAKSPSFSKRLTYKLTRGLPWWFSG